MTWHVISDATGARWAFNNDGIYMAMRAVVRARLIRARSHVVTIDHGFLLPRTYVLETDWNGFRTDLTNASTLYWQEAEMQLRTNARLMRENLIGLLHQARADLEWMHDERRRANRDSSSSIDSVVENWGTALAAARFVRDASATFLVVGAGLLTGGSAVAAAGSVGLTGVTGSTTMGTLAVGSVMRGAFTYQDTGNVGSAVLNTAGTFTVGAIGLGAPSSAVMSVGERATILVIQSSASGLTSGGQALLEGKTVQEIAQATAVSAGLGILGAGVGEAFSKASLPIQVLVGGSIDMGGNAAAAAAFAPAPAQPLPRPSGRGEIDYCGLPATPGEDIAFVRDNCMFQV